MPCHEVEVLTAVRAIAMNDRMRCYLARFGADREASIVGAPDRQLAEDAAREGYVQICASRWPGGPSTALLTTAGCDIVSALRARLKLGGHA